MTATLLARSLACLLVLALASRAVADPAVSDTVFESLSATHHTSSVRLDGLDSSYRVAAPAGALANERLVLRNLDPRLKLAVKLHAEGRPDLASADGMLRSILADAMSPEARAVAIWQFVVDWRYNYIPAEAGDESNDPVKLINVYGYGLCGNAAAALNALSAAAGMPARRWSLGAHVVAEVWYDGGWHMLDADHEVYYRASDGHIMSVAELAADGSPILATTHDPVGSDSGFMAELYANTANHYLYPAMPASTHRIEPVLEPLDEVRFDLAPGTAYAQSDEVRALYPTYGAPPSFANGTLTRRIDVAAPGTDWLIPVEWPFLLVGGDVSLQLARDDADAELSISCGGATPTQSIVPTSRSGRSLTASLRPSFAARRVGAYACNLRLRSRTALSLSESIVAGQVDWLFQFAPRALQQVRSGGTTFRAELVPVDGPVPADWQGFEIVHAWQETRDFIAPGAQLFSQAATAGSDLLEAAASFDSDSTMLTFLTAGDPMQKLEVFLDTDANGSTGYRLGTFGADFRVDYGRLYAYTGQSSAAQNPWSWSYVGPAPATALRSDVRVVTIPTSALGLIAGGTLNVRARSSEYTATRLDELPREDTLWPVSVPHVFGQSGAAATDLVRADVAFDASEMVVSLHAEASALENVHIYLDTDSNARSGYPNLFLGAEFLIENGFLHRHVADAQTAWSWSNIAPLTRRTPRTNLLQVHVPLASLDLRSGTPLTLRIEHWRYWDTRLDSLPRARSWRIPVPNVVAQAGASDGDLVAGRATVQPGSIAFTLESLGGPLQLLQLFLDLDADPSTGYADRSVGVDYLIANDALWRFTGQAADDWSWTRVGPVELRSPTPRALEVVLPTVGLALDRRRASVFVEHWENWYTPLDSLPRAPEVWQLAW